ncbi:MAG: DUF2304 domain-containing protein [Firmicutes bacterium]|nr:DUF2304 domain-containing protein [Bacillota bacterium]
MIYIVTLAISVLFLVLTFVYLKKRRLDFKYAIIWIITNLIIIVFALNTRVLDAAAGLIGVEYAPAMLFAGGLVLVMFFIFHITLYVSDLKQRIVRLTQEIAILKNRVEKEEKR